MSPYETYGGVQASPDTLPQQTGFGTVSQAVGRLLPVFLRPDGVEAEPMMSDEELRTRMLANEVIPVANGYSFVPDWRPAGQEDELIPADEFTAYFMSGQIPYAGGGAIRSHDFIHGPSYRDLFHNETFARLVRESATVAHNTGLSYNFTGSIDKFGDAHILLTRFHDGAMQRYESVQDAKVYLRRLLLLRSGVPPTSDMAVLTRQDTLDFSNVWNELGLASIESETESELARENPEYLRAPY